MKVRIDQSPKPPSVFLRLMNVSKHLKAVQKAKVNRSIFFLRILLDFPSYSQSLPQPLTQEVRSPSSLVGKPSIVQRAMRLAEGTAPAAVLLAA